MVTSPCSLNDEDEAFVPGERETLRKSMTLMRHLLVDAQVREDLEPLGWFPGKNSCGEDLYQDL